jgi:hypothetical protein
MLKQFGSATILFMAAIASALTAVTPAAAQVSRYHMDFKPADFNATSPNLVAAEANIGPTNYAMPGFGWDETHGQQARPGVFIPALVPPAVPEDPGFRAFVFLFGGPGQTNSSFTTIDMQNTGLAPVTFPKVGGVAVGINPADPSNAGLGFSWSQHLENTNTSNLPVHVRLAVQTSQAGNPWYVSNGIFNTGLVGATSQGNFDPQTLLYNPAKANWLGLTIGALPADGVTVGATPAVDLSGLITGVGFVASFDIQSTVHIDFLDIGIPPVPGDVTGDRIVDINDYNIIKGHFGTSVASRTLGDVTGDGVVNLADFAQWKGNFPFPGSGGGSFTGTVPEPASVVMMVLALPLGWGMLRLRKKKSA